jgi:hypothetical protein
MTIFDVIANDVGEESVITFYGWGEKLKRRHVNNDVSVDENRR